MSESNANKIDLQIEDAYAKRVDGANLVHAANVTLQQESITDAHLTISIVDDETMRELNAAYRDINATTDVLSFSSAANDSTDETSSSGFVLPPDLSAELANYLGDIVVALPYAENQAAHYSNALDAELRLLVVHGTLHLLGYDHDSQEAEDRMWTAQASALHTLGDHELAENVAKRLYDESAMSDE